jgi:hypothetical protein
VSTTVGVNPPKTPVTEGSDDKSFATMPNVCKMPGPPAPFVPTPLPNLGKSGDSLSDCTSTVLFDGCKVAIKGSYYMSKISGDMASKGTGGGIVSSVEEGKSGFAAPGSMNVKAEGKNIQLLSDAMFSNGNAYNSANQPGNVQLTKKTKKIADDLCAAFCAYGKANNWKGCRSSTLEANLRASSSWASRGMQFGQKMFSKFAASSTAQLAGKAAIAMGGTGAMVLVVTKPDAALVVGGKVKQCFDFKFPGDRWRNNQFLRQKRLAGGKDPVEISRGTCGC